MSRAGELSNAGGGAEWWALELPLPDLLFRIDFVTMDSNSGAVDNNGWVVRCGGEKGGCLRLRGGWAARRGAGLSAHLAPVALLGRAASILVGGQAWPPQAPGLLRVVQPHRPPLFTCRGRDFQLALGEGAISEQELQLKRMQLLEAYEEQRIEVGSGAGSHADQGATTRLLCSVAAPLAQHRPAPVPPCPALRVGLPLSPGLLCALSCLLPSFSPWALALPLPPSASLIPAEPLFPQPS